jgi:hypothetical protein
MMCSLVAPPTMASWADERSVREEQLEEVGPVDYVVLEWRASSDASKARDLLLHSAASGPTGRWS